MVPRDGVTLDPGEALDRLGETDVFDLLALEPLIVAADPDRRLGEVGLRELRMGRGLVEVLPDVVEALAGDGGRVLVAGDTTPVNDEGGRDVKGAVLEGLAARFDAAPVVLGDDLHADEATVAAASRALAGAACVVCVGSGTATDICKAATAQAEPRPALVFLQTANSVNGFADAVSVLLKSGVKRTTPSRWADALLVDLDVVAGAPATMTAAGFGDSLATFTAAADAKLANLVGMDESWHPVPFALAWRPALALLEVAEGLPSHARETLEALARSLTASGLAIGLTGSTASLSGGEHLVSHLLDMHAGARAAPSALHGAQVGVATILMAIVWEEVLALEALPVGVPGSQEMRRAVDAAFARLDPEGSMRSECWSDCSRKLDRWSSVQDRVAELARDWAVHRETLRALTLPAKEVAAAMRRAGAAMRFAQLEPPVSAATGRWALANCHLMRDRFTAVDLLAYAGQWGDATLDRILARAGELGAGL